MPGLDEEDLRKDIERFVKAQQEGSVESEEFTDFKKEFVPLHFNLYEKACNLSAKIFPVAPDKNKAPQLQKDLETCHINTTPVGVTSFALLFPLLFIIFFSIISFVISFVLLGGESFLFFIFSTFISGVILIIPLTRLPSVMATSWRMRSGNQMVLSIFYIVSYMRHTSNLELAIKFTSDHITPPLSIDFKKLLWDIETSKYESMKDSLDHYLETWKDYNPEFVDSMHMIESSLYEPKEEKRIDSLEKALTLILEANYEKMLHFAQDLKSPMTMLHMLGIILPILGLVILPLVVSFMGEVKWYHIGMLYNIFLPALVFYLGKVILTTRPTGYGQADITEVNPELKKYKYFEVSIAGGKKFYMNPKWISVIIIIVFVLIGISPLILHAVATSSGEPFDIIYDRGKVFVTRDAKEISDADYSFLGFKEKEGEVIGPFGLGATLVSILIPLGFVLGLSFYYKASTKKLMKIREETKKLEDEFASALFQLGNRVGDGLPAELAFQKVSDVMENSLSGTFFEMVSVNIATLGMGVEEAIFDKKHGALNKFPSALIESSMEVFVESSRKGPDIASKALINISSYIKEMHRVDERLQDLMSEITSSMKSQINFLAPLISGIVMGLTSMITTIIDKLGVEVDELSAETTAGGGGDGGMGIFASMFGESIPTYYFQIVIGLYVLQITYILTLMLNTIQSGYDPLNEKYLLGVNINKSGTFYAVTSFAVILGFNIIASAVVSGAMVIP